MVWQGLGVNYKGSTAKMAEDAAYLKGVGVNKVRIHIPNDGSIYYRDVAAYFKSQGFYTVYGITAGSTLTAANWATYAQSVVDEATYCQANNICSQFVLGNELHYKIDGTTLVAGTLRSNVRSLATGVKAVFSGIISYDVDVNDYTGWISEGLGNIDILGFHQYSNWESTYRYLNEVNMTVPIPLLVSAFGSKLQVNEFNLDSDSSDIGAMSIDKRMAYFRKQYQFLKDAGVSTAYVFGWVGYKYQADDNFSMKKIDGTFNDQWDVLLTDNKRRTFIA